jgi:hypothetical protein
MFYFLSFEAFLEDQNGNIRKITGPRRIGILTDDTSLFLKYCEGSPGLSPSIFRVVAGVGLEPTKACARGS